MTKRSPEVYLVYGGREQAEELFSKVFRAKSKYLCGNCKQLRGGPADRLPTQCGGCGSTNIDVETDVTSQRLEILRAGGPEAFEELKRTGKLRV